MIRVVVDTGVFVSALIGPRGGTTDRLVRAFADDRIEVVACPMLLAELERVLLRPKFRRYVDATTATQYVERIARHATVAGDPKNVPSVFGIQPTITWSRSVVRRPWSFSSAVMRISSTQSFRA